MEAFLQVYFVIHWKYKKYRNIPQLYISTFSLYCFASMTSGAMYPGVPHFKCGKGLCSMYSARPKSAIFISRPVFFFLNFTYNLPQKNILRLYISMYY